MAIEASPRGPLMPFEVERAVMAQRWERLAFLHWRYDAEQVQRLLPPGLEVEVVDGDAWVGLIPFTIEVRPPRGPALPWVSRFCETNVRTYVVDARGRSGIWFFSLDASRLLPVVTALAVYRLPYRWSRMRLERRDDRIAYTCRRRWPGPRGARSRVVVAVGAPFAEEELGPLDHILTARWRVFSAMGPLLVPTPAWHPPWPLRRGRAVLVDDELVAAAGLPAPLGEPLVHWSDGVDVRIGSPERPTRRRADRLRGEHH